MLGSTSPDGHQAFDPAARYVHKDGVAYKDFAAYLCSEPDPQDRANVLVASYRAGGRSEAFCRAFREGYDQAGKQGNFPHALKAGYARREAGRVDTWRAHNHAINAGLAACASEATRQAGPFPGPSPQEIADTPHNRAVVAGFARATELHGDYHES